ncbi:MAG TPA: molybdopterin-dependent oxidoreductase, partial [Clostridium sp.]
NYVASYTDGFNEYKEFVKKYTPEYVETITGIKANDIRKAMREYSKAKNATILYGMGVCHFSQAVDVVKGLASIALLTGNFGRPNVGIGPVRGQNNVQGSCDMGALPNVYPGYQKVTDKKVKAKFEKAWGVKLSDKVGHTLTEVPELVLEEDKIKAYYIFGEDPVQSDPNAAEVRATLDKLELVIVQDIFMNKTALHADVVLPATSWGEHDGVFSSADRGFQRIRKAVQPKGNVKTDWQIICEISTAMGYPMSYDSSEEIWNEMIDLCPDYTGATYEKMDQQGSVQWPCPTKEHKGTAYLYEGNIFRTENGKGQLFACEWRSPMEALDDVYPLSLSTVREVGHYSVRTMTGNCRALRALEDEPGHIQISVEDAQRLGIAEGHLVRVTSRRGSVLTRAAISEKIKEGSTYMTYHWWVGSCNELTSSNLDPISKTPEFKYCAVNVKKIENQALAEQTVKDEYNNIKRNMKVEK